MFPLIVADIGGTNARFSLVTGHHDDQFQLDQIEILRGQDFSTFSDALRHYLDKLSGVTVKSACVAVTV